MANEVYANGREISCKAASGKSVAAMPDVCLSPPSPPAGPVPIPYPNTGMASDTSGGSKTVQISGQEIMIKDSSFFKKSTGDEAATKSLGMGVLTHQIQGKVYFTSWSMDVKIEGENAVRHLDLTTHNHMSKPGNTPPWAYQDAAATKPISECSVETMKKDEACRGLTTRAEQCGNAECTSAKKCLLVTYSQGGRTGSKATVGCCDKEQPHHLIEAHGFYQEGGRNEGKLLDQFPNYDAKNAPCVCGLGSRWTMEHGAFHALVGQKENAACASSKNEYGWTYGEAKKAGVSAHADIYPASHCSPRCLEAQLDAYHKQIVGVDDNTPLRTGKQGLMEYQRESPEEVMVSMEIQMHDFFSHS